MQAHLRAAQANAEPKLLKELAKPTQDKTVFKNPMLQKNKNAPRSRHNNDTETQY